MIRVLLVDDSPSVRAVLRRFLRRTDDIEVVGEASNGKRAVEAVMELAPQVVLMDLQMPVMDGYTAIERIMSLRPTPILVLSSRANRNQMSTAFEAIQRGAVEVLPKPEDTTSWNLLAETLPKTVRAVAAAGTPRRRTRKKRRSTSQPTGTLAELPTNLRFVAVGASTGGPAAIREFLEALPGEMPVSVLIVQHIPPGFEVGLADWLNRLLPLDVQVAEQREKIAPGEVRLAPAGYHMRLDSLGVIHLDARSPARNGHRPSVDELFCSLARHFPVRSAGVLLTGMGSDGVDGLEEIRRCGGVTMAQDEASSVIYGMPRVALERRATDLALPPRELALTLARALGKARG